MSLPSFTVDTTAEEVATAFAEQTRGKNGVRSGKKRKTLLLQLELPKLSEEVIKNEFPSANIRPLTLDLTALGAVRKAAT
ncbi:hypothetical protein C8F04DRAFT_1248682 [Mycena alexandri]|uniref:Uncharacterized protein n=1 Tax=Mycena alexandri TaxID=1745969 RepID=A0AAD6XDX9_9AGAR|nr:hypothetical protein C8F04DRAFT_1248682 [Mycena alexandri]